MTRQPPSAPLLFIYALVILASFLAGGYLAWKVAATKPPLPVNDPRVQERKEALQKLREDARQQLEAAPTWLDQAKGIVRLPIPQAEALLLKEWSQDPVAGRAKLLKRLDQANPPPPPAAPSPFE